MFFVRFFGWLFGIGAFMVLVVAGVSAVYLSKMNEGLPDYTQLKKYEPPVMTRIHASDGQLVAEYAKEKRLFLPIQLIPEKVKQAFLSAEDKTFYEHPGLDIYGIGTAMLRNFDNARSGRRMVGASTITQQVAKNFLLTNEQSIERKVKEAMLALRIEQAFTKDQILELYLNEIYLGLGAYGVAAASLDLLRQAARRADAGAGGLSRRASQGAEQLPSVPLHRRRHRPAQLGDRPDGRQRLRHRGRGRRGQGQAARRRHARTARRASSRPTTSPRRCAANLLALLWRERSSTRAAFPSAPRSIRSCRCMARTALHDGLMNYDQARGWRGAVTSHRPPAATGVFALAEVPPLWRRAGMAPRGGRLGGARRRGHRPAAGQGTDRQG